MTGVPQARVHDSTLAKISSMQPSHPPAAHELPAYKQPASALSHGAEQYKVKGEDAMLIRTLELADGRATRLYAVFDGHGGPLAARYCAEHMAAELTKAYKASSASLGHSARVERACRDAFVRLDKAFVESKKGTDGTTATVALVDADTIVVANVGDSNARLLVSGEPAVLASEDHRLDKRTASEEKRVRSSGSEIGRLRGKDGKPQGPERMFPGALCVSRSIGDSDAGKAAIAEPAVRTFPLPAQGGTLLIASDGVWDFVELALVDRVTELSRGPTLGAPWLAKQLMRSVMQSNQRGDDATLIAVHLAPSGGAASPPQRPASASPSKGFFGLGGLFGGGGNAASPARDPPQAADAERSKSLSLSGRSMTSGPTTPSTKPSLAAARPGARAKSWSLTMGQSKGART